MMVCVWMVMCVVMTSTCSSASSTIVQTKYGTVDGVLDGAVKFWKGIPFAAPPVDSLRWKEPQPHASWTGVRDTKVFANDCLQWHDHLTLADQSSEDCLYLNVWAPANNANASLPVMLFFFGGSWSWGGTQFVLYDAARILRERQDVIIVTSNYRLGALGFLASSALAAESPTGAAGNYGLLDQRAAMSWVHDNIANFGGDPTRLTIWGESAGSGSVSCHLAMPNSWPFFTQGIMESGPIVAWIARPLSIYESVYSEALTAFKCSNGTVAQNLACLRSVDAFSMMNKWSPDSVERSSSNVTAYSLLSWGPVIDGVELTDHPVHLARAGAVKHCPILLGSNRDEGSLFVDMLPGLSHDANEAELLKWATQYLGPTLGPKTVSLYPCANYSSCWWAGVAAITDGFMACPARFTATAVGSASAPAFLYQFLHQWDETRIIPKMGVFHGSELVFVFAMHDGLFFLPDKIPIPVLLSSREQKLSAQMVNFWINFGTRSNPGSDGGVQWPRFNTTSLLSMSLDIPLGTNVAWRAELCDFWNSVDFTLPRH